ncbi:MAG: hypothetical protein ACK5MG_09375 [Bacteroidales bacterium]
MDKFDKQLEEYIGSNKEQLEEDAPQGHFTRFKERLDAEKRGKAARRFSLRRYWQVAAALLIGFLVATLIHIEKPDDAPIQTAKQLMLSDILPEYAEAEHYYNTSSQQGLGRIQDYVDEGVLSKSKETVIKEELAQFNETYSTLIKELEAEPDDERIINSIIKLYRIRLSVIERISKDLELAKEQKQAHHEESNI